MNEKKKSSMQRFLSWKVWKSKFLSWKVWKSKFLSWKVWKRAFSEFYPALLIGFVWMGVDALLADGAFSAGDYIKAYVASLLPIAYFLNQFNRVQKAVETEETFSSISASLTQQAGTLSSVAATLTTVSRSIEQRTQELLNTITGGDSFVYVGGSLSGDEKNIIWMAFHHGKYPVQQVQIQFVDAQRFAEGFKLNPSVSKPRDAFQTLPLLAPDRAAHLGITATDGRDYYQFNFFITLPNASLLQTIVFEKIPGNAGWRIGEIVTRRDGDSPGECHRHDPSGLFTASGQPVRDIGTHPAYISSADVKNEM